MAYLDDLTAARDSLVAALAAGPLQSGLTAYVIDGEEYKIHYADIADALLKLDQLVQSELNRVPARRSFYIGRPYPW